MYRYMDQVEKSPTCVAFVIFLLVTCAHILVERGGLEGRPAEESQGLIITRNKDIDDGNSVEAAAPAASLNSSRMISTSSTIHNTCLVSMVVGPNPNYALGALVLAHSFRKHSKLSPTPRLVLLHDQHVPPSLLKIISSSGLWDELVETPYLRGTSEHREMFNWRHLLFKFNAWRLEKRCKRVVWMGTDSIVIRNIDHLLSSGYSDDSPPSLMGVPDYVVWKWYSLSPAVNGDFLVFEPSQADFEGLVLVTQNTSASTMRDWEGAGPQDQGILNRYFNGNIVTLPWFYSIEAYMILTTFSRLRQPGIRLANHLVQQYHHRDNKTNQQGGKDPPIWQDFGIDPHHIKPELSRAAEFLRNWPLWRTLHFATKHMKPWNSKRGDVQRGDSVANMTITSYIFDQWDDLCLEVLKDHPGLRQNFAPFGPHCLPKGQRRHL